MSIRLRTALSLAFAAALVAVPSARAQDVVAPAPATSVPSVAPAGPTADLAVVGVRHQVVADEMAPQRRGGSAPGVPLMIVGGAAILVGLVIGGGAGGAIAVAGAVVGLYGLYQYLQ